MRIALLSNGRSVHTIRWADGLAALGYDVHLIGLHALVAEVSESVTVHRLSPPAPLGYFLARRALRRLLADIEPALLHAHYATGYGTLARLCGFRPMLLSVWGTDVYEFPRMSPLHRRLFIANLSHADEVLSTSHAMAAQVRRLCPQVRDIAITPFGVDTARFSPAPDRTPGTLRIGTVKMLERRYGLDILLRAYAIARARRPRVDIRWRLVIAGAGSQRPALEKLASELGITAEVDFLGFIANEKVPQLLNTFDLFVAASRSESFGVSVLEASACALPVIVSDVGGLPEVVDDGRSGFVVTPESADALAEKILRLADDASARERMGAYGRSLVTERYDWQHSLKKMDSIYRQFDGPQAAAEQEQAL